MTAMLLLLMQASAPKLSATAEVANSVIAPRPRDLVQPRSVGLRQGYDPHRGPPLALLLEQAVLPAVSPSLPVAL